MSVSSGKVTVGTAVTEIPVTSTMPWTLEVKNDDNTDAVYVGGAAVTTTTGLRLSKEERVELPMGPLDRLYAVSTKSGHSVSYVAVRKAV